MTSARGSVARRASASSLPVRAREVFDGRAEIACLWAYLGFWHGNRRVSPGGGNLVGSAGPGVAAGGVNPVLVDGFGDHVGRNIPARHEAVEDGHHNVGGVDLEEPAQ